MKKSGQRTLIVIVRVLVSAGVLVYLLTQIQLRDMVELSRTISLPFLLMALMLQCGGVLISALKWWLLLRSDQQFVRYGWTIQTYLIGHFFNNFLPTMIGGDTVRIYQLARHIGQVPPAFASVFVERLMGFLALTMTAWGAIALNFGLLANTPALLWSVIWCALFATGGLLLVFGAPIVVRILIWLDLPNWLDWRGRLHEVTRSLSGYTAHPRMLGAVIFLSFGYHLTWITSHSVLAMALGLRVSYELIALMVPVSDIVGLIPVFFNGLGAREGTYVLLLGQQNIPAASAIALALLIFIVRLVLSLVGGGLYLLSGLPKETC